MDNIGLQPPQPSIVTVEEPKIIKPAGGFGRIMRKHGLKFLMGGLLTLLLGAGIWLEVKVVQQKQQVESQATGVSGCAGHIEKCECDNDPDDDCSWKSNGSCYGSCYSGYNDCAGSCESEPDEVLPPVCQSTSISSNTLSPGGSLTITSAATTADITGFSYAFYNRDNLYEPDNPKPICTGAGAASDLCPNGGTHLVKGSTVPPTSTNTITVNYNEVDVPDLSWGGQNPKKIQVNAFFGNSAGWSQGSVNCKKQFELTIPRPDYCISASADKATMLPGETLTLSSVSNTAVNGFWYMAYNLDNLNEPGTTNAKPVCTGTGTNDACPNGGTPLTFGDPNNSTGAGRSLRTNGSVQIPYANLFVNDKNWNNQQVKRLYFMAYFSLNGGQWSWPQDACKAFTAMGTVASPSPSPNPIISCTDLTSNVAAPVVGQSVTGTCHGSFSSVTAPVARFGVSINGGEFMRSEIIPLNAAGTANYTVTVPIAGTYLVQCQICTDATATTCTTWGQAN